MIQNKWKIAFWIVSILLLVVSVFAVYSIIDQAVTITYMQQGYTNTENDLNTLIQIVNNNGLSKKEVCDQLVASPILDSNDCKADTISLERIEFIFNNDTLQQITKQW